MSSGETVLPQLSDDDINKLYKEYSAMDGKHKNFKGTKREYCATVGSMIRNFLSGYTTKSKVGSGKIQRYATRILAPVLKPTKTATKKSITETPGSGITETFKEAWVPKIKKALEVVNINPSAYKGYETDKITLAVNRREKGKSKEGDADIFASPDYKRYELNKSIASSFRSLQDRELFYKSIRELNNSKLV